MSESLPSQNQNHEPPIAGIPSQAELEQDFGISAEATPPTFEFRPSRAPFFTQGETTMRRGYEEFASLVDKDEVVRTRHNDGKPVDEAYLANNREVRDVLVEEYETMYESPERFLWVISDAHQIAARGNVHAKLSEDHHGILRTTEASNSRMGQAFEVARHAAVYGDPYAQRFHNPGIGVTTESQLHLEGIPDEWQSKDRLTYRGVDKAQYEFDYPPVASLNTYFQRIQEVGADIKQALDQPPEEVDRLAVVEQIAKQYQYAANARPFAQINNSLFMNLTNMQLKMTGLKPIEHGILDLAAQRMQPEAFVRYFTDAVDARQARD